MSYKKKDESELFDESTAKFYYLNICCTKGVRIDKKGRRERLPVSFDGITIKMVSVMYWEQCGNFSFPNVRQRRKPGSNQIKTIPVYPDDEVEPTKWMPFEVKYPGSELK